MNTSLHIERFVVNFIEENCYLLWDETKEAAIVDCGAQTPEELQRIDQFIQSNGLSLKCVLNTHGHFDHVFGNQHLFDTYGLQPMLSADETKTYELAPQQMCLFLHRNIPLQVPKAGRLLHEGEVVAFGNQQMRVIATPGHTPGGICFYHEKEGVLLSGDSLFMGCIGRCDLPGGNEWDLVDSLRNKILTLPENVRVLPGHGPATTIRQEKTSNPYL